jgi:uncharacterized DUF497 family protein
MDISFDSAKSEKNLLARGVSFELAAELSGTARSWSKIFGKTTANGDSRH